MVCPLCGQRKAKRACPALGKQICAVCCGTKRLVEISCTPDCGYLTSARHHPPAVVQRQQEHDRSLLLPALAGMSERQARLFLMFAATVARHRADSLQKLVDADISQAAEALAATLETSGRGIVYEHQPSSLPAARLLADFKALLDDLAKSGGGGPGIDRDAAIALRRMEQAARQVSAADPNGSAFQQLISRMLAPPPDAQQEAPPETPASSIILP
jgi:hypothetical protein